MYSIVNSPFLFSPGKPRFIFSRIQPTGLPKSCAKSFLKNAGHLQAIRRKHCWYRIRIKLYRGITQETSGECDLTHDVNPCAFRQHEPTVSLALPTAMPVKLRGARHARPLRVERKYHGSRKTGNQRLHHRDDLPQLPNDKGIIDWYREMPSQQVPPFKVS